MTYEIEPKRDEIRWDLHPLLFDVLKGREKTPIPEGVEVITYTNTFNIDPEPLFMLGPPGTGRGMIARQFYEFRLAATARERCDWCVPQGGFHDEFAHSMFMTGGNPFTLLNERIYHHGPPDPYPDCTFRMRLVP